MASARDERVAVPLKTSVAGEEEKGEANTGVDRGHGPLSMIEKEQHRVGEEEEGRDESDGMRAHGPMASKHVAVVAEVVTELPDHPGACAASHRLQAWLPLLRRELLEAVFLPVTSGKYRE